MSKDRFNTTLDLILLMLFTVSSIFLGIQLFLSKVFSPFLNLCILVLLLFILVMFFFVIFKTKKLIWLRRSGLILVCAMICWSTISIYKVQEIKESAQFIKTYYQLNLIVNDTAYDSSDDLVDVTIGVMMNDRNHLSSFDDLNEAFKTKSCNIKEYHNLDNLVEALKKGKVQAMILSDHNLAILENNYHDLSHQLQVLSQNEHAVEISHKAKEIDFQQPFTILLTLSDTDQLNYVSSTSLCYILFIDPITFSVKSLQFPDNLYIPNAAYDSYPDALYNVSYNGIDNLLYSIENIFGIEFDYFIKANEDTFIRAVDIMQGIYMNVEECSEKGCILTQEEMNQSSIRQYFMTHYDVYPILEGIFNQRDELIGTKLINFLNNYKDHTFTNLTMNKLEELFHFMSQKEWTIEKIECLDFVESKQPCISNGTLKRFNVSIMSTDYIRDIYTRFLELKHIDFMKNFIFDLNTIHHSVIQPMISDKIITQDNMSWKIDNYFSVLPESTIQPIEVEKWQGNINFDKPNFDPYGQIYPIE